MLTRRTQRPPSSSPPAPPSPGATGSTACQVRMACPRSVRARSSIVVIPFMKTSRSRRGERRRQTDGDGAATREGRVDSQPLPQHERQHAERDSEDHVAGEVHRVQARVVVDDERDLLGSGVCTWVDDAVGSRGLPPAGRRRGRELPPVPPSAACPQRWYVPWRWSWSSPFKSQPGGGRSGDRRDGARSSPTSARSPLCRRGSLRRSSCAYLAGRTCDLDGHGFARQTFGSGRLKPLHDEQESEDHLTMLREHGEEQRQRSRRGVVERARLPAGRS